jgi:hypothetical protein
VTLTSWAEGGVAAAIFPIWLLFAAVRATWRVRGRLAPLVTLLAFLVGWDALFSPMTLEMVPLWGLSGLLFVIVGSKRWIMARDGAATGLPPVDKDERVPRVARQR